VTPLRSRHSLLLAALLAGQLVCLLVGVLWFGQWLERGLSEVVRERLLAASRQMATQFGRSIELMGIDAVPLSAHDFDRLQTLVEDTRLPNAGELIVIDSETGQVLAHPKLRTHPEDARTAYDEVLFAQPRVSDTAWQRASDGAYVLAARELPDLGAHLLIVQPRQPMQEVIAHFVSRVRLIGLIVVVVLVAFTAVLSMLIIRGYEDRLASINAGLEDLVDRRSRALMSSREGAIFGLAKLAEARDGETGEHLDRISSYVALLAGELSRRDPALDARWVHTMAVASSLHDIGKVGIPDAVLHKPGPLTDEERQVVQKHPTIGGETLAEIQARWGEDPFLKIASEICSGHHERWDGKGYPRGLSGLQIPLPARLVALADVYDALTSRRAYKDAHSHDHARRFIVEQSGHHFDPAVVDAFLAVEHAFRDLAQRVTENEAEDPGAPPPAADTPATAASHSPT
jgi:putative two-component system response regulator